MKAWVLCALMLGSPQAEEARRALDGGAFREAHALLENEPDALEKARGKAELFYRARDPLRALAEAQKGLKTEPSDLLLLHRACAASLWLGQGTAARDYAARLAGAVGEAELDEGDQALWEQSAAEFAEEAERLFENERSRARAVGRARLAVFASVAATLIGLACFRRRGGAGTKAMNESSGQVE